MKEKHEEIHEYLWAKLNGQPKLPITYAEFDEIWGIKAPDPSTPEWEKYIKTRYRRKEKMNRYWRSNKIALRLDILEDGVSLILRKSDEAGQAEIIRVVKRQIGEDRNIERRLDQYSEGTGISDRARASLRKSRDIFMSGRLRLANTIPDLHLPKKVQQDLMNSIVPVYKPPWETEEESAFKFD